MENSFRNEVGHFTGEKLKFYSECEILGHPYLKGTCQICGKVEPEKIHKFVKNGCGKPEKISTRDQQRQYIQKNG